MTPDVLATCDIVVVGAGIAGLCTAYELRRRGFDVVVVEQRFPAFGASGRNPGCLWIQTRRAGAELDLARAARAKYVDYIEDLGDVFEFRQLGGLMFFETEEQGQLLEEYLRDRLSAGVQVELLDQARARKHAPLLPATALGAVYSPEDAQLDAQQFVATLAAAVVRSGVRLFENTAVLSTIRTKGSVEGVRTVRGDVRASGVVWATGAWTLNLGGENVDLPIETARMGQVITQPFDQRPSAIMHGPRGVASVPAIADLPGYDPGVFAPPAFGVGREARRVDYDDVLAQNRAGGLVIGGGVDEYGSLNPHISIVSTHAMISTTYERFPEQSELGVTGLWAGLTTSTPDGLPIVDRVGDGYVNAGHAWGIATAPVAAEVLAELIAGEASPHAAALAADRLSLQSR